MNELMTIETGLSMPLMSLQEAAQRRQALVDFTATIMKDGYDYGKIPGTNKDTLLKPGAEKLTTFFGLSPQFEIVESVTDWTGKEHGDEPFFYFAYRCTLRRGDVVAGEGDGSCNSWEKKYRYRKGGRVCPECGQDAIIKGRAEYGGGWLCFAKKGGCGAKWTDGAQVIESQQVGQVKNDNPADLVNTVQKMAQKRALVAATLIAVNASEFFTQDMEDYADIIQGEIVEDEKPEPEAPKQAANGNGKQPKAEPEHSIEYHVQHNTAGVLDMIADENKHYAHVNHVKATLKKLGHSSWTVGDDNAGARLTMYGELAQYASYRDGGMDGDAALDAVKNDAHQDELKLDPVIQPEEVSRTAQDMQRHDNEWK